MKKLLLLFCITLMSIATYAQEQTKVDIVTNYGKIVVLLYDNTPLHKANMVKLANEHFFDSTLFHRVIPHFVIQGGDPKSKTAAPGEMLGNGEIGYRVPGEFNDSDIHKRGALGMARDGNPKRESSGCQFYIVTGNKVTDADLDNNERRMGHKYSASQRAAYLANGGTPHLDGDYTVFGEVVEGMDVVDAISAVARDPNTRPLQPAKMLSVRVEKTKKKKKFLGIF